MKITMSLYQAAILILVTVLTVWGWTMFHTPDSIITPIVGNTKTIQVNVGALTPRVITEFIKVEDVATVNRLMKENAALKVQVQQLTVASAESTSHIGRTEGTTTIIDTAPSAESIPERADTKTIYYDDQWRLQFWSDGITSEYWLKQKFVILNSAGVNRDHVPVVFTKLYEIGRNNERIEIPITESTTISTVPTRMRWYLRPSLQAGAHITRSSNAATNGVNYRALVALPLLKRGTDTVPERSSLALLTPAVAIASDTQLGVLPISVNLGHVKYVPLSDVWVSPFVGVPLGKQTPQFGIAVTATF